MIDKKWFPIKEYIKKDNVHKIASKHAARGLLVVTTLVVDGSFTSIKYYTRVTNLIRWPAKVLYWLGYPIIPIMYVFLGRLFTGEKHLFSSPDYKENMKRYADYYYEAELIEPITSGSLYSADTPNWVDDNNKEQLYKYAKSFSYYMAKMTPQRLRLLEKYLNTDIESETASQVVISYMAGITPPGDIVNKLKDRKSKDLYNE